MISSTRSRLYRPTGATAGRRDLVPARIGISIGLLISAFVLVDLLFRPAFVPISVDTEATERATPMIVTLLHSLTNAALILPCLYGAIVRDVDLRRVGLLAPILAAFTFVAALSLFAHLQTSSIVLVAVLALNFAAVTLFVATRYRIEHAMEGFWTALAVGGSVVLVMVVWVGEYHAGRLVSHGSPNYWGRVAFAAFCGSICIRRLPLRYAVIAFSIVILMLTSSRGSMLGVLAGVGVLAVLSARKASAIKLGLYLIGALALLLVAPLVLDSVFHLSDPRRGVDSGGTGRSVAWAQTWDAFASNPLLGIGFRRHEEYVTAASSAHNAYLATLAEVGVFGFALYLLFVVGGAWRAFLHATRPNATPADVATAMFMTAFILLGFIETQAMTTGSPTSVIMFFAAASAWRPLNQGAETRKERQHA